MVLKYPEIVPFSDERTRDLPKLADKLHKVKPHFLEKLRVGHVDGRKCLFGHPTNQLLRVDL